MHNTFVRIDSTIVASRLKMARENKERSKVEVAKALNIATSSMTYYEQGKAIPSIDKLYALADYYGVTMDWLCGRVNKNDTVLKTEFDVAEVLLAALQFEGIELDVSDEGTKVFNKVEVAKFALTSSSLNKFFVNRFYLNRIKENCVNDASEETKQAITAVVMTRQEIESMYVKMLEETDLKLKDGQNNMCVRRDRRKYGK